MALAVKPAFHLHRGRRLDSSLSRSAIRFTHSRVVFERVRLHSIAPSACSRYRSYNRFGDRLSSIRARCGGQAILEISYSMASYPHRDYFCRSSRRSKILSDGFSAAPCHNAPRFSTITKALEPIGDLRSGIAPLYRPSIGDRKSS
jgi:hypothetical protein